MRLEGKTALVTGGAQGIGAAIVRRFVAEGAEVLLVDRDEGRAHALARELGDAVSVAVADAGVESQVAAAAAAASGRWDHLDILVNNAGMELNRTFDATTSDEWGRVLDVNLRAPWLFCKFLVPAMVRRGRGSVINVSSMNGLVGLPNGTAYGSSKGGLIAFTKHMAIEQAASGVRFNAVCPGVIATPMLRRWMEGTGDADAAEQLLVGVMPIGRLGEAAEVAAGVLFFASDDGSLCQGSVLSVDGGVVAQ